MLNLLCKPPTNAKNDFYVVFYQGITSPFIIDLCYENSFSKYLLFISCSVISSSF